MKVNISSYAGSVVAGNWTPALAAAWTAIKATGGNIHFDVAEVKFNAPRTDLIPDVGYVAPFLVTGDGSNRIKLDMGATGIGFYMGNLAKATFRDIIMHGNTAVGTDCSVAIYASYAGQLMVENSMLCGLTVVDAVIKCGASSSLYMTNSPCSGNSAPAVVLLDGGRRLVVDNCEFLDHQTVAGVYYAETPTGVGSWIKCINPEVTNGANNPVISIRDCRFDEGANNAIFVDGYPHVKIERCSINVQGTAAATGIRLENVDHAIIEMCNAGYTTNDRPAVKLVNCGNVIIIGQSVDHGIFRVECDAATNLKLIESPGVVITRV